MSHKNLDEIFEGVDNTNENDVEELALSDDHEEVEQDNEEDNDNHGILRIRISVVNKATTLKTLTKKNPQRVISKIIIRKLLDVCPAII